MPRIALLALCLFNAGVLPLSAQMQPDSGYFVIRLGTDTLGIERYVRTADRLEVVSVQRSPRTAVREFTLLFDADGVLERVEVLSRPADAAPAGATRSVITFPEDGTTIEATRPDGTRATRRVGFGREAIALNFDIYSPYEVMLQEVLASDGRITAARAFSDGGESPFRVERIGRDSATLQVPVLGELRARIDRRNRILALSIGGEFGTSVVRTRSLDLDELAAEFAARDAAGRGLGVLSPRDTVIATVQGAEVFVDYGRPYRRGRPVFGGLVPYNRVWRLGANLATHFYTERDLIMDGAVVPAGMYTLYLLPGATDWRLIINRQTGQPGTEYDEAQDVARVRLRRTTLPEVVEQLTIAVEERGEDGVLRIAWDRTEASAAFTFAPMTLARRLLEEVGRAHGGKRRVQAVRTLLLQGHGEVHWLGQNVAPEADLPVLEAPAYRRAFDFANRRQRLEVSTRLDAIFPGAGLQRQVSTVDGDVAFETYPNGIAVRVPEGRANLRAIELLHHPVGALQAAWSPGADVALEPGRPNRLRVTHGGRPFSIEFDPDTRLVTAVEAQGYHALLGDVPIETRFDDYRDVDGIQLPGRVVTRLHGRTVYDMRVDSVGTDADVGDLTAPAAVREATMPEPPPEVAVEEIAPGVWYLTGQSHHSVLVEFRDHLMLVEAPVGEARTLAVIAKARELRPDKPLRYLVSTHHHFDHAGGVRAAIAEGLTIVAHEKSRAFLEDIARRSHSLAPDALARNPRAPVIEAVADRRVFRDAVRTAEVYAVRGSAHAETMLMVYLPRERLLVEADLYTPAPPGAAPFPAPFAANLLENIRSRRLRVERIVPLHGRVVPFDDLVSTAAATEP